MIIFIDKSIFSHYSKFTQERRNAQSHKKFDSFFKVIVNRYKKILATQDKNHPPPLYTYIIRQLMFKSFYDLSQNSILLAYYENPDPMTSSVTNVPASSHDWTKMSSRRNF